MIIVLMFFGWKFLCKKYFISKNHSERIIKNWQPKIKNRTAVILGILFFILSFTFFIISSEYSGIIREIW